MDIVVLGKRSSLTNYLKHKYKSIHIISSEDLKNDNFKNRIPKKFNLIINLFYPSKNLHKISNYEDFFELNFKLLSKFLRSLDTRSINKIIYSSSASVYGDFHDHNSKRNIYALSKLLVENYLLNIKNLKKKIIITRIYNMYDENENFSLISKVINNKSQNLPLKLFNNGEGIRDFIHTDDVARIYVNLLNTKFNGIIEIGTGAGYKIRDIVHFTNTRFVSEKKIINEKPISVANTQKLKKLFKNIKFKKLNNFLYKKKYTSIAIKEYNYNFPNITSNSNEIIIIYGAGYSGKKIFQEYYNKNKKLNFYFIDDDINKIGKKYKSVPIIDFNNFLIIRKLIKITDFIFAIPSLNNDRRKKLVNKIKKYHENITILPGKNEIINKSISLTDLKDISFSDILKRKTSNLDNKLIKYLNNKSVLITGGAGSIGSELVKQIHNINCKKIIIYDNNETEIFRLLLNFNKKKIIPILGDICDEKHLKSIIKKFKVDYVFHAAAYKHLGILENNFKSAIKNNLLGTINVLNSLNKNVKNFILISTDKAANPTSNLGISKRLAEIFTLYWKKNKTSVVRFGNVFGSRGSVLEVFFNQIKNKSPLTVSHKQVTRYFMSIKEACNLVIQTGSLNNKNGIYLLNMGDAIKIKTIADNLINFLELKNYPIIFTKLKKGEKINEVLSSSSKKINTKHKDIFLVKEKIYKYETVKLFFEDLITNFDKVCRREYQSKIKKFIK